MTFPHQGKISWSRWNAKLGMKIKFKIHWKKIKVYRQPNFVIEMTIHREDENSSLMGKFTMKKIIHHKDENWLQRWTLIMKLKTKWKLVTRLTSSGWITKLFRQNSIIKMKIYYVEGSPYIKMKIYQEDENSLIYECGL